MIGVVFDTNVLVSANINHEGLEALVVSFGLSGELRFFVSLPILDEYERVLRYSCLGFLAADIEALMRQIKHKAWIIPTRGLRVSAAKDEPDNRFLECAEAAGAAFLVTGNKRHFPARWKKTKIVNARELLEALKK
jgi:putative PIN family toxin of toxin-antitoxin system